MTQENQQNDIFTDKQISNFVDFSNTLKRIHTRLINQGYRIKDNQIIPPEDKNSE
jgi:hypothetical protein